jgi:hypothetical protein
MQHQTVHGDACSCHSCARTTGSEVRAARREGEGCTQVYLGAGAEVPSRGDFLAEINRAGRLLSAPVIAREARLR